MRVSSAWPVSCTFIGFTEPLLILSLGSMSALTSGKRTRQRRHRIPLRNRSILGATIRRTPPTARKSRRERRVERPTIHPRLPTRHDFGECH
jgi:hypothetical protein